jgi:para-aminobenzoate synthetase component 1
LPAAVLFEFFRHQPFCFFLDGSMDPQNFGRYSFMGGSPFLRFRSRGDSISIVSDNSSLEVKGNPFDVLGRYLDMYRLDNHDMPFPFGGGAVGYFSYDLCHFIERLPSTAVDDLGLAECWFGFYDLILAFDNLLEKAFVISAGFPETDETRRSTRAGERIREFKAQVRCLKRYRQAATAPAESGSGTTLRRNFTHESYVQAVEKARQYIIDGDIFEVNLSQRFTANCSMDPFELYLKLRRINPAPFAAYLGLDEVAIVSASPERFLRCTGDLVETRPIKGTKPRGRSPEEDLAMAEGLRSSLKDHAENMMIVDLERNDLGRVCRFGTVKVTELATLEKFPTVFHLTSTVVGRLRAGVSRMDLLKATFPGGSITGAPKVRAMEIIDELEPTRRSIYTGSIGYFSFNGGLDLNIAIRTFLVKGDQIYFQAGGAVVYDSDPESEYQETLHKVKALVAALDQQAVE